MSLHLGTLYHWSPKQNRDSILREGLTIMNSALDTDDQFPWICLSTTPSSAWALLPIDPSDIQHKWDLWQVNLKESDKITIRGDFCPLIREIRVHHGLPADRVWWVAERNPFLHE